VIKATHAEAKNVLLVDAGNALWSEKPLAQTTQGKVIIEGMNLMGYDAMLIGDQDLRLGPEVLRQRIAEAEFPVLSANVALVESGELLAEPYTILQVGGRQVGIIGLTSDLAQWTLGEAGREYTILNANDVLPGYVAEVAKQTNIIVVLSNMGYDEDQRLSSLVPDIGLIVGGYSSVELTEGWRNEQTGTVVVQAGNKGEGLGRCRLHLTSAGVVDEQTCELLLLTDEYPDDPEMRAFLDSYAGQ
jgi:2',3'-cyclic-nucleotide 2'-phosphodiesterase (5'-nucleotidase family)